MAHKNNGSGVLVRNFIFGVEDSVVSTVGLLSGIAAAGVAKQTVFLTGAVLIFVEAISMAIGSFLSEQSIEEFDKLRIRKSVSIFGAITMFLSYFVSGFIPLLPYIVFDRQVAFFSSIIFSIIALIILGLLSAHWGRKRYLRRSIEMAFLGGAAIMAGIIVGNIVQNL